LPTTYNAQPTTVLKAHEAILAAEGQFFTGSLLLMFITVKGSILFDRVEWTI